MGQANVSRRILLLVPDLGCHGAAKQAKLLASALPREQFTVQVGVAGNDGIFSKSLRDSGVAVHVLGDDPLWLRTLSRLKLLAREFAPHLIQAWSNAIRWAALARLGGFRRPSWKMIAVDPPT